MKTRILMIALVLTCVAQAKEPKVHQSGTLLQMGSAECGVDENSGKSFVGEMVGTDSAHKKTHALLCQEYLLQSDTVIYRIRPVDEKHPVSCRWVRPPNSAFTRTRCCCRWKMPMQGTRIQRGVNDATSCT